MTNAMQHHHVTLTPQANKLEECRLLIEQCAKQIILKKAENGPLSWFTSYDDSKKCFYIEALFANQDAVLYHQMNIQDIVKKFSQIMASPPETVIRTVFLSV